MRNQCSDVAGTFWGCVHRPRFNVEWMTVFTLDIPRLFLKNPVLVICHISVNFYALLLLISYSQPMPTLPPNIYLDERICCYGMDGEN